MPRKKHGLWYYYPQVGKVSDKTLSKFCEEKENERQRISSLDSRTS